MVLSRRDVLIEVISNGKIERIFADALVPAGKNLAEVSGECLVVEDTDVSSSSFAQKILVAGTEDEDAASRVALHAKKELASAIMVTREPRAYVASSTPSFLISEGELDKFNLLLAPKSPRGPSPLLTRESTLLYQFAMKKIAS